MLFKQMRKQDMIYIIWYEFFDRVILTSVPRGRRALINTNINIIFVPQKFFNLHAFALGVSRSNYMYTDPLP